MPKRVARGPLYQMLTMEAVEYLKSDEFKESYLPIERNNDVLIRTLHLHMWLISRALMHQTPPSWKATLQLRTSLVRMNTHRFPWQLREHFYSSFHSHLPIELFMDDFEVFFLDSGRNLWRQMKRYEEGKAEIGEALDKAVFVEGDVDESHPVRG